MVLCDKACMHACVRVCVRESVCEREREQICLLGGRVKGRCDMTVGENLK